MLRRAGLLGVLVLCTAPVMAQNTVTFLLDLRPARQAGWFDPMTEAVGLRGGTPPLNWGETLPATDADGDGRYEVTVTFPDDTQRAVFKVKVDGADNPNDGWENGRNRTVTLTGRPQQVIRAFDDPPPSVPESFSGTIRTHRDMSSQFLAAPRHVFVYLPPGYDTHPERRYPVLYLHDGRNVFDASEVGEEWRVDETAQRLIETGQIAPLIIVGVGNTSARTDEYTPTRVHERYHFTRAEPGPAPTDSLSAFAGTYRMTSGEVQIHLLQHNGALQVQGVIPNQDVEITRLPDGRLYLPALDSHLSYTKDASGRVQELVAEQSPRGGLGVAYGRFLVEELKPLIDRQYRTLDGPAHTAVGGSSLGGLITLYLGLQYPHVFGGLLVVSPSVWWDNETILSQVRALTAHTGQRIWVDMGTEEGQGMLDGARRLKAALLAEGWVEGHDLHYLEAAGAGHDERAWSHRVEPMLRFLFPSR